MRGTDIVVHPLPYSDGGGFIAYDTRRPGCIGTGDTEAEAVDDVERAAPEWDDEMIRRPAALSAAIPPRA